MTLTESEIGSQPELWRAAAEHVPALAQALRAPGERMLVVGCGTSAYVAASIAVLREQAGLGETDWAYASDPPRHRHYDRVVALTRSGTTTEVLRLLDPATTLLPWAPGGGGPEAAPRRVVVTAVAGGPAAELADEVVVLAEADERSVVQTRFPTTLLVLARAAFGEDVEALADQCTRALARPLPVDDTATMHRVYLGQGWTTGLALEAALKVREAAQAWAESYPALDYRHGPIACAGPGSLVWLFGESDEALVRDVEATGATVLHTGSFDEPYDPLVVLVLAQRHAVESALRRGLDPDNPRHLTRSVVLDPAALLNDPSTNGAPR